MNKKQFKPSEFYRKQRPENFSDSYQKEENKLTLELLSFELDKITTNQKHDLFENLCVKLAWALIAPNLIPQTWPTGWWDGKTDSETHPVSENISIKWFHSKTWWDNNERWAIAISAKKDWKSKLKKDVTGIINSWRGYTKIFFLSNQTPSSKLMKETQDSLKKEYWVDVIILNWKWVLDNIFKNGFINIAVKELNLDESYKTTQILWANDAERVKILEDLEEKIKNPDRYLDYDYQIVIDAINAANISRHLELPKDTTTGRYERAKRLNKKFWSLKLDLQILYQLAWTYYMYFDDYLGFITEYKEFCELILRNWCDADDLEFYSTLTHLLITLSVQVDISDSCNVNECIINYISILERYIDDTNKNTNHFIAKAHKLIHLLTEWIRNKWDVSEYLKQIGELFKESQSYMKFPFWMFKQEIEVLWNVLLDSAEYDILINIVSEIDAKRNNEISSWVVLLERGIQKIDGEKYKDGVIFLWRTIRRLAKEESDYELYYALLYLSVWYKELGLHWASYNALISALHIKIQIFKKWDKISKSILVLIKEIIDFEIIMGRFPSVLSWYELYLIFSSHTDDESKDDREAYIHKIDAFLSVMIANADFNELSQVLNLSTIFEKLGLEITKDTYKYILWWIESIDQTYISALWWEEKVHDFFIQIRNQPLKAQFLWPINIGLWKGKFQLSTKILGTNIKIKFQENILHVEALLAFMEWLLATSFDISWIVSDINVYIEFTDKQNEYDLTQELNCHIYRLKININPQDIHDSFFHVFAYIMVHSFIWTSNEVFEKLFQSDEVFERVSLIISHPSIFRNIIWEPKFEIQKWEDIESEKIVVKNIESPLLIHPEQNQEELEISCSLERHDNRKVYSIINIELWNKAWWQGFWLVSDFHNWFWLVLFFKDRQAWKKIFEELSSTIWPKDIHEQIRLSIVKWFDLTHPLNYRVHICQNIQKDQERWGLIVNASRYHTMEPLNNKNLQMIETLYEKFWKYTLYAWYGDIATWEGEVFFEKWIEKEVLYIRNAYEIMDNDIDIIALHG